MKFGQGLGDLFTDANATEVKQRRAIRCGFVATNSITQGEQVGVLWSWMLAQGIRIRFAHRTFQWSNDAPGKAAVHCVIVGFGMEEEKTPRLFEYDDIKGAAHEIAAKNINPYLVEAPSVVLPNRRQPICVVNEIREGSALIDDGHFLLTAEEAKQVLAEAPSLAECVRPFLNGDDFLNGRSKWCLWLEAAPPVALRGSSLILSRINAVKKFRLASGRQATKALAATPKNFGEIRQPIASYLFIPKTSSELRQFVPIGFVPSTQTLK